MNELQVKTIEITPATIEFNHEEIEKELEISLKKYEGLVFSEDAATDLRKTIAELRKGKNAVDRYRIDTKKQLNEPVKAFEAKCKQLDIKFESVITPLVEQQNEFEEKRRAEKLARLEEIRLEHINNHDLAVEYHSQIVIDDSMLAKSASLRQVSESLEFQVKNLKTEQENKELNKNLIEQSVKLANAENDLNLSADAYVRLLDYQDASDVQEQIKNDANVAVEKRERERLEKERKEREKQAELERLEAERDKPIEVEEKQPEQPVNEHKATEWEPNELDFEEIPFSDPFMEDPFADEKLIRTFEVIGTEDDFRELDNFLRGKGIGFEVLVNE